MKKLILLSALLGLFHTVHSQSWQWANHYGSSDGGNVVGNICLDDSGNVYMTGRFDHPYGVFGSDTLFPSGSNPSASMFILKTDNSGSLIWAMRDFSEAAAGSDVKYDIVSDAIYATGFSSAGVGGHLYLEKKRLDGSNIWGISVNVGGYPVTSSISVDNSGNIYLLGKLQFNGMVGSFSVAAGGFIAKYDSSGACLFAKNISDSSILGPLVIKYFNSSLFISGASYSDPIIIDTASEANHGMGDCFIARFDTLGNILWLRPIGGPDTDYGNAFDIDGVGSIYVSGTFTDTVYFESTSLINNYPVSFYLSKWDVNGNINWAIQMQGTSTSLPYYNIINSLSTADNGLTYMTGSFLDTVDFGGGHSLITTNTSDMFVARYDSSGNCLGALNFGSANGNSIVSDTSGVFYTAGTFRGTVQVGSTTLNPYYTGTSNSLGDIYLAKHDVITGEGSTAPRLAYSNSLHIYANPNEGKCTITIPEEFKHENNLTLQVFDINGKLLQQTQLEMAGEKIKLNISAQAKGIYNAVLSNGKKSFSGRIVFE